MKTAKEWFEENLTNEQYMRAMELMEYQGRLDRIENEHPSFRNALVLSFTWNDTPENARNWEELEYWDDIYKGKNPDVMPWKNTEESRVEKKAVEHPYHYGGKDNPYEAIKVIEAYGLDFCLGNVIKYTLRAGKKEDELQDLEKASWYINRKIEQIKRR